MILILANKWDLTVDLVVLELQRRGAPFVRLNTEDLPRSSATVRFPSRDIELTLPSGVPLSYREVTAVWNRRPGYPFDDIAPSARPPAETIKFVVEQWFAWLEALQLRPDVLWVNHPNANGLMESKARQLALATELGFLIPDTLISNDAVGVREWLRGLGGQAICKALHSPLIEGPDSDRFIFTTLLDDLSADVADALRLAPAIFQRALIPKIDYRVTVVGSQVLPVRVELTENVLDWRTARDDVRFVACELSADVIDRCRRYVGAASLTFGAIDLVESEGQVYFLEINPNGEWGWLQRPHGIPIADALCDLLTGAAS